MDRLKLGPASREALCSFSDQNRVAGQEPLSVEEWLVALAAVGLLATARAAGQIAVAEECLSVLTEASRRSGAALVSGTLIGDEIPF